MTIKVSIEKTPEQKLSQYAIDTATTISITHLPKTDSSRLSTLKKLLYSTMGHAKQRGLHKDCSHYTEIF